jgi:hypothetical protein
MRQPAFRALADLLIEPPLADFAITRYDLWEPIAEIGYRCAKEALAAWAPTAAGTGGTAVRRLVP